jgi:hypothetical protein
MISYIESLLFNKNKKKSCLIICNSYPILFYILKKHYKIHLPKPRYDVYSLEIASIGSFVVYKPKDINLELLDKWLFECNKQYPPNRYDLDIIIALGNDINIKNIGISMYQREKITYENSNYEYYIMERYNENLDDEDTILLPNKTVL